MKNIFFFFLFSFSWLCGYSQLVGISVNTQSDSTWSVQTKVIRNNGDTLTLSRIAGDSLAAKAVLEDVLRASYNDAALSFHAFRDSESTANMVASVYRDFTGKNVANSGNEELRNNFAGEYRFRENGNNNLIEINPNGNFEVGDVKGKVKVFSAKKIRIINYFAEPVDLYSKDLKRYIGELPTGGNVIVITK